MQENYEKKIKDIQKELEKKYQNKNTKQLDDNLVKNLDEIDSE